MIRQQQQGTFRWQAADRVDPIERVSDHPRNAFDQAAHAGSAGTDRRRSGSHQSAAASSLSAARAARRPASTSTRVKSSAPTMKNPRTARMALRPEPLYEHDKREHGRPEHARISFEHAEERKKLRGLLPRDHAREQRTARAPGCHPAPGPRAWRARKSAWTSSCSTRGR